jgi:hypothetical protein
LTKRLLKEAFATYGLIESKAMLLAIAVADRIEQ